MRKLLLASVIVGAPIMALSGPASACDYGYGYEYATSPVYGYYYAPRVYGYYGSRVYGWRAGWRRW